MAAVELILTISPSHHSLLSSDVLCTEDSRQLLTVHTTGLSNATHQPPLHPLGPAQPGRAGLLRPPAGTDAPSGPAGGGGTRFANAYTTCPICVPARASLATGRYVHHIVYTELIFRTSQEIFLCN